MPWSGIIDQSATPLAHEVLSGFFGFFHDFRMQLFFLVAGFFARLLCNRGGYSYLKNRFLRVGVPLVAAVLIALPLVEVMTSFGRARSQNPDAGIPWIHSIEHCGSPEYWRDLRPHYLWFLVYLVVFYPTFLGAHHVFGVLDRRGRFHAGIDWSFARLCRSRWIAVIMVLPTVFVKVLTGRPLFAGESLTFLPAPTNLLAYGLFFAFGWLLFRQLDLLSELARHWKLHAVTGGVVWLVTEFWPDLRGSVSQAFLAWSLSLSLFGALVTYASGADPIFQYLAGSSYWLYLAHVPLVMFLQVSWAYWQMPWWLKFPIMNCALLVILLPSYDLLVRETWIGIVLNGRRRPSLIRNFSRHVHEHEKIET